MVPKGASHGANIEDVYGVVLEDKDEDSGNGDLDPPTSQVTDAGADNTSKVLVNRPNPIPQHRM